MTDAFSNHCQRKILCRGFGMRGVRSTDDKTRSIRKGDKPMRNTGAKGRGEAVKGIYGITAPSGGGKGRKGGSARAGAFFAPPSIKGSPGTSKDAVSRKNNDGDLWTRHSPYKRPRNHPLF